MFLRFGLAFLVAASPVIGEDSNSGVDRENLAEWVEGPGKTMGKALVDPSLQLKEDAISTARGQLALTKGLAEELST